MQHIDQGLLAAICYRMLQYKRENKELFHYLLYDQRDELSFRKKLISEIDMLFADVNKTSVYLAKKTIRKILRYMHKYLKFSGDALTAVEIIMHFCNSMNSLDLYWQDSKVMVNLYKGQLKKAERILLTLHEDLQYDYHLQMKTLYAAIDVD